MDLLGINISISIKISDLLSISIDYRIGIEFVDQESISIVSVSKKVVSKTSGPRKKVNFFGAPIQKAHEYVLNLRRQLSSSLFRFVAHRSKFGIFTVTKHPSIRAFVPKKSNLKFFCVPDELGSQIVLRI